MHEVKAAGIDIDARHGEAPDGRSGVVHRDFEQAARPASIGEMVAMRWELATASRRLRSELPSKRGCERIAADRVVASASWMATTPFGAAIPREIVSNRLGWLDGRRHDARPGRDLQAFAAEVRADGYRDAVSARHGRQSSLAPEVMHGRAFGTANGRGSTSRYSTRPIPRRSRRSTASSNSSARCSSSRQKSGGTHRDRCRYFAHSGQKLPRRRALRRDHRRRARRCRRSATSTASGAYSQSPGHWWALLGAVVLRAGAGGASSASTCARCSTGGDGERREPTLAPCAAIPARGLGAAIGEVALAGRDKGTFVMPPALASFGLWVEQLIAESTGKVGQGHRAHRGRAARHAEASTAATACSCDSATRPTQLRGARRKRRAPVRAVAIPATRTTSAREFFRWEFAMAVAGNVLGINPFDQPNVQESKDATARILAWRTNRPVEPRLRSRKRSPSMQARRLCSRITALPRPRRCATSRRLTRCAASTLCATATDVATTVGFGPRFLHSTGQLHKGGPNTGVFLQVVAGGGPDVPIPGKTYTFGDLNRAQAIGDLASLQRMGAGFARVDAHRTRIGNRASWRARSR